MPSKATLNCTNFAALRNKARLCMTKTHRSHTTVQFVEFFVHANINSEPKSKSNRFLINLHSTWNALPEDLRAVMDQAKFRKQLKAHYFTLAFNVI